MGAIHCPQRSGNGQQWQYQMRGSSGVATRCRASSQAYDSRRGVGNLVEGEFFRLARASILFYILLDRLLSVTNECSSSLCALFCLFVGECVGVSVDFSLWYHVEGWYA